MTFVVVGIGLAALVGLTFLARLIETTYTRLGRARASGLDDALPDPRPLADLVADREAVVGPASAVRLIAHAVIVGVVAVMAANRVSALAVVGVVAATVAVLYLVTEAVPRAIAIEANDRMALRLRWLSRGFAALAPLRLVLRPARWLAGRIRPADVDVIAHADVAEDELVALATAAAQAELIELEEASLIGSVFSLGDTIAREVMIPRPDMLTIPADMTVAAALHVVVDTGFSRLPVEGDSPDDIVGVVLSKDLLAASLSERGGAAVDTMVREVMFVPETKRLAELMREMQASKRHLAIVVDEYGGTAGLVSLEDIIEEVVGEIVDEFDDEVDLVEHLPDGCMRLSGRLAVTDLRQLVDDDLPQGDWDTVGGLVFDLLGHVPEAGESVRFNGHLFVAEAVEGRRIDLVRLEPVGAEPPGGADEPA